LRENFSEKRAKNTKKAGFQAENRDFGARNGPKTAFSGGFSPFLTCAVRCGSFLLKILCRKPMP
jgi:hypothetical protein